jgi:hypothetical protein
MKFGTNDPIYKGQSVYLIDEYITVKVKPHWMPRWMWHRIQVWYPARTVIAPRILPMDYDVTAPIGIVMQKPDGTTYLHIGGLQDSD